MAEARTLDTAVILTTTGVFGGGQGTGKGFVSPLTLVGGLSLFLRTVLTLQRAGFTQLLVLAGDEEEALKRSLRGDARVTLAVRWMPVREFPLEDPRSWEALAGDVKGACLVVGTQILFSRALVQQLRCEVQDGEIGLVVNCVADQESEKDSVNPVVQLRGDRLIALRGRSVDARASRADDDLIAADMIVLPGSLLRAPGTAGSDDASPLVTLIERAAAEGRVRAIHASPVGSLWYRGVHSAAGLRRAERALFQSLEGEFEGFVDTYFNRKVSSALTRLFLRVGLSPNAITVLSMVIGLLAAASIAVGSYTAGVFGALLFQLSVIVDCCDGEVARLTFRESRFGEELDLTADNVVHGTVFAGVAWAVFLKQGGWAGSWLPLALGGAAVLGNVLSWWLVKRAKAMQERKGWSNPAQAARVNFILKNMASRDFSLLLLMFALFDKLGWFLWLVAIGSNIFWVVMAWITRSSTIARA